MKHYIISLFAVTLLSLVAGQLGAETRVYEERTGDKTVSHRFDIREAQEGKVVELTTQIEGHAITQKYELDQTLATRYWEYHHPGEKTRVSAKREGNKITLSGLHRGKPIEKVFKIDGRPWNQSFNLGLEQFALSGEKKMKFWSIGTDGPGRMKITTFAVKKKPDETIVIDGQEIRAAHLQISLTGILSLFWKGRYWYDRSGGTFLRYRGKNKPGAPVTQMDLVKIERAPGAIKTESGRQ